MNFRDRLAEANSRARQQWNDAKAEARPDPIGPPSLDGGPDGRPWYRKKRWIAAMVIGALVLMGGMGGDDAPTEEVAAVSAASSETAEPEAEEEASPARDVSALERLANSTHVGAVTDCDRLADLEDRAWELAANDGSDASTLRVFSGEIEDRIDEVCTEPDPTPTLTPEPKPKPTPKPKPKPTFDPGDYTDLTAREFAKVVRNPDAHVGEKILIFGEVFQFDAATGPDSFLASVDGDQQKGDFVFYDHNALLVGQSARQLDDVVQGDLIAAWVTGTGELSYETQIGGETTVPTFVIDQIKVTGSAS